jgi:histidinol-phosphate aminotransferase
MTAPRRETLDGLPRYAPEESCPIDLSDNTNLWGSPPAALDAIRELSSDMLRRYPETYNESLKEAIAEYVGLTPNHVVTGVGSDDILDSTFRAFGDAGSTVAMPDPTFVMVPVFARLNGLRPVPVTLTSSYDVDVDATIAANAPITYLCSPNNPTGTSFSRDAIDEIVRRTSGIVVIDEAYFEFSHETAIDLINTNDRVVIARTFSKAFGLAGLRVGYAIGAPGPIAEIEKARGPYKVGVASAAAACAALRSDLAWVREHAALAVAARDDLLAELRQRRLSPAPSSANFVFVPVANARRVAAAMRARGVAVRPFGVHEFSPALEASAGTALRIAVGPPAAMVTALAALDDALAEVGS